MIVTTLGTGSPLPDPNRAGPATLVQAAGKHLLFDAGRGVLMRLAAAMVAPGMLDALLLTHLHSDHTTDVNDVITTRWVQSFAPMPLTVVGPEGTTRWIDRTMAVLQDDIGYRLAHHEDLTWQPENLVTDVRDGVALDGLEWNGNKDARRAAWEASGSSTPPLGAATRWWATASHSPQKGTASAAGCCRVRGGATTTTCWLLSTT